MYRELSICITVLLCASSAVARSWTDRQGRTVEADVVQVKPNKTVVLKMANGRTVTVAFDTFIEANITYLETRLARQQSGRSKPHPVSWNEMNALFGIKVWQDDFLWDDLTDATAQRLEMKKESKTDFMENHRAYPLGKKNILGEPVYTTALYGGTEHTESLSMVFLNLGDVPRSDSVHSVADLIEASGMHVHDMLISALGKPKRDTLGRGEMRETVWRWNWNEHALLLSLQEGKYAALRIMPTARADRSGRGEKITEGALKKRMTSCVERRDNGDVIIRNIPMVDQGPKGYCSPATWERYLRYMEIPADMYLLALAAGTRAGGGTSSYLMIEATRSLISSNGRELETIDGSLEPEDIAEYIDQGLPIMWRFGSTPAFQRMANATTARRNGDEVKEKNDAGQAEDTQSNGHICLIIGYNKESGEIAISDSWGPKFAERWVPFHEARRVSYGNMNIIKW